MLRYQDKLPFLPIPPLESTIAKYLESLKPLQEAAEAQDTQEIASKFLLPHSIGQRLQRRLLDYAKTSNGNWQHDWRLDSYLQPREPIVPFTNYFVGFQDLEFSVKHSIQAATICIAALRFKEQIDAKTLEPDLWGRSPLCMEQYSWIFHTCWIP